MMYTHIRNIQNTRSINIFSTRLGKKKCYEINSLFFFEVHDHYAFIIIYYYTFQAAYNVHIYKI